MAGIFTTSARMGGIRQFCTDHAIQMVDCDQQHVSFRKRGRELIAAPRVDVLLGTQGLLDDLIVGLWDVEWES